MATEYTYPVTSYSITLWGPSTGLIHLKDGEQDAGYIYVRNDPVATGVFRGGRPYIVWSQPPNMWLTLLDILRNESPLFIRGYQPNDRDPVQIQFGTSTDELVGEGE